MTPEQDRQSAEAALRRQAAIDSLGNAAVPAWQEGVDEQSKVIADREAQLEQAVVTETEAERGYRLPESYFQRNTTDAFDKLTSEMAVADYEQRINEEDAGFDYENEIANLENKEAKLEQQRQELLHRDASSEGATFETDWVQFVEAYHALDDRRRAVRALRDLHDVRRHMWETSGILVFRRQDQAVEQLATLLEEKASRQEREFMDTDEFRALKDQTARSIDILAADKPFEMPLAAFVSASSFISWQEGRGHLAKDGRDSKDVIEDYAGRETEIPSVEQASALILPNGEVILMTENSHRVAAAKQKGQATIPVESLRVYKAKSNAVSQIT